MKQCNSCKEYLSNSMFSTEKMTYCKECRKALKIRNWYRLASLCDFECNRCSRKYWHEVPFHFVYPKGTKDKYNFHAVLMNHLSLKKLTGKVKHELGRCEFLCERCFKLIRS